MSLLRSTLDPAGTQTSARRLEQMVVTGPGEFDLGRRYVARLLTYRAPHPSCRLFHRSSRLRDTAQLPVDGVSVSLGAVKSRPAPRRECPRRRQSLYCTSHKDANTGTKLSGRVVACYGFDVHSPSAPQTISGSLAERTNLGEGFPPVPSWTHEYVWQADLDGYSVHLGRVLALRILEQGTDGTVGVARRGARSREGPVGACSRCVVPLSRTRDCSRSPVSSSPIRTGQVAPSCLAHLRKMRRSSHGRSFTLRPSRSRLVEAACLRHSGKVTKLKHTSSGLPPARKWH